MATDRSGISALMQALAGEGGAFGGTTFVRQQTNRMEEFVKQFIVRHHLDKVQKVQALDILAKYKAKAQPASAPASQPTSPLAATTQPAAGTRPPPRSPVAPPTNSSRNSRPN